MLSHLAAIWIFVEGVRICQAASIPAGQKIGQFFPPDIQNSWGPSSPFFTTKQYTAPPSQCKITQVNIIERHGARFPTSGNGKRIQAAVKNFQLATQFLDPTLDFVRNFTYTLGVADLVPFGAMQSSEAGSEAFKRYSHLVSNDGLPFVRADSSQRVIDSATNWTAGFALASHFKPILSVILDENLNDTLDNSGCPKAGDSDAQTDEFTSIFATPIAARLNTQAPGSNLSAADVTSLMDLCGFDTVATEKPSPFCNIFTADEFAQYEYLQDLDKFYGTGYGQALGPVQGVGYINELLARLTGTPIRDNTQTNKTLDNSPLTFPLDRKLYADFSHDNQMAAIYSAMGLFKQPAPLDPKQPDPNRTWIASHLTPFSARMVTERLACWKGSFFSAPRIFVRILVNDALQPLEFCGGDKNGLCPLSSFIQSQSYARNDGNGDFAKCFA